MELLTRSYYWPKIYRDVNRYLKNYHTCQRARTSWHAPSGILQPLPVPEKAWQHVSMDFVTGLSWFKGKNAILVIVCQLTKMRHLIPCRDTTIAEELAQIYLKHVARYRGLPRSIVTDWGLTITSRFRKAICKAWGTNLRFSIAFHLHTDGQTEKFNAVMEQYLRSYINYLQHDWAEHMPLAKFAANNQASETTGVSPFFANYGYDPRWTDDP